jgi:hypothetical protein
VPDARLMAGCTMIDVRQGVCTCACTVAQKGRATCVETYHGCVAACVQMPGGNAEEPLTLLSSDEDVPAQPVGRQDATGAGAQQSQSSTSC